MQIQVKSIKEVIDSHVKDVLEQLEGNDELLRKISRYEAIEKLGLISSIIISLHDKVDEPDLKNEIWNLKNESDLMIGNLFSSKHKFVARLASQSRPGA